MVLPFGTIGYCFHNRLCVTDGIMCVGVSQFMARVLLSVVLVFLCSKCRAKYGSIVVTIGLQQGGCKTIELRFGAWRSLPSVKYLM